ncbi:MAG: vitamin K epoxide reductase family protein [Candidatus Paceibacterota bacterium]|nr:MAG: vitamin K epoxide reductase family protein [Candidatus Paceibacterota bacterium]
MTKSIKIAVVIFLVVGVIGFLDATYLTVEHYRGNIPPCTIQGCEVVLTSEQSKIFGVPVALLGALYYLVILILSVSFLDGKKEGVIRFASRLTFLGFIASVYFVYLQFFVIGEICQYCMISAGTSTLLFVLGIYILIKTRQSKVVQY